MSEAGFPPVRIPAGNVSPARARLRQLHFLAQVRAGLHLLQKEAGEAGIDAPGFIELSEWASWAILENVERVEHARRA